jgi:DNA-binding XRE family transcriptional regulator
MNSTGNLYKGLNKRLLIRWSADDLSFGHDSHGHALAADTQRVIKYSPRQCKSAKFGAVYKLGFFPFDSIIERCSQFNFPAILALIHNQNWRKGWFLHPFCHLVIKAVRVDSHPLPDSFLKMLTAYRLHNKMSKNILAAKLGVSLGTLKNWEFRRTHPNRKSRPVIRALFGQ